MFILISFDNKTNTGLEIAHCAPAYQVVFEKLLAAIELHPEKRGVYAAYQVVFEKLLAAIELHPEKRGVYAPIGGF